jgi:GNAT superfamily N-acetyltransferase
LTRHALRIRHYQESILKLEISIADYAAPTHARALVDLLDAYARDPMGGGHALTEYAKQNLVRELARRPAAFSVLAFCEGQAIGLANRFEGFSTFRCLPLVNIHDIVVLPGFRGRGVGRAMLEFVEREARRRGCCKLTLEVLEGNRAARAMYLALGFEGYRLSADTGRAMFLQKDLAPVGGP